MPSRMGGGYTVGNDLKGRGSYKAKKGFGDALSALQKAKWVDRSNCYMPAQ